MRSRLEGRNIPEIMAIEIDIRALMISSQIVENGVKHFDWLLAEGIRKMFLALRSTITTASRDLMDW